MVCYPVWFYVKVTKRQTKWSVGDGNTLHFSIKMGTKTAPWFCDGPYKLSPLKATCLIEVYGFKHSWSNNIFRAYMLNNRNQLHLRWGNSSRLCHLLGLSSPIYTMGTYGGVVHPMSRSDPPSKESLHPCPAHLFPTLLPKWSFQNPI